MAELTKFSFTLAHKSDILLRDKSDYGVKKGDFGRWHTNPNLKEMILMNCLTQY